MALTDRNVGLTTMLQTLAALITVCVSGPELLVGVASGLPLAGVTVAAKFSVASPSAATCGATPFAVIVRKLPGGQLATGSPERSRSGVSDA